MDVRAEPTSGGPSTTAPTFDRKTQPTLESPASSAPASPASLYSANTLPSQDGREGDRLEPVHHLDETDPLMQSSLPPPAYSAAVSGDAPPASGASHPHMGQSHEYGTMPRSEALGPGWRLVPPQGQHQPAEERPVWMRKKHRQRWGKWCCLVMFLVVVLVVVVSSIAGAHGSGQNGDDGGDGNLGPMPTAYPSPFDDIPPLAGCRKPSVVDKTHFGFSDIKHFALSETEDVDDWTRYLRISGRITLVPGKKDQAVPIMADVSLGTADESILEHVELNKRKSGLDIKTQQDQDNYRSSHPCVLIATKITIRPGEKLDYLSIASSHLALVIEEGVSLTMDEGFWVDLKSGSMKSHEAETFNYRKIIIKSNAGSVKGDYALYDLLKIEAKAGSVDISVLPKKEWSKHPAPAEFKVDSQAGHVAARFDTSGKVPERDYRVSVDSHSGSVQGIYLHGNKTSLSSRAGSIKASVQLLHADAGPSTLTTTSDAGSTKLDVLAPLYGEKDPVESLKSRHKTTAGSIGITYPKTWEGELTAETTAGSVVVEGEGVEIVEDQNGLLKRFIRAKKGKGKGQSSMEVASTLSSVRVTVGLV